MSQCLDKHILWAVLRNISKLCPHPGEGLFLALRGFFCSWTWAHGARFWLGGVTAAKHGHTDFSLFDGEILSVFGPVCLRSTSQGYFILNPNYLKLHLCSLKRWKAYWGDTPFVITLCSNMICTLFMCWYCPCHYSTGTIVVPFLQTGRDTKVGQVLQAALGLLNSCLLSLTISKTSNIRASSQKYLLHKLFLFCFFTPCLLTGSQALCLCIPLTVMLLRHKSLQKSFTANSAELLTQSQCFLLFSHWVVFPASGWWFASFSRDKFVTPGDEAIMFSGTGCRPWMTWCPTWCLQCCSLASHHCLLVVNTVYRGSGPVSPVPGSGKKGTVLIGVG